MFHARSSFGAIRRGLEVTRVRVSSGPIAVDVEGLIAAVVETETADGEDSTGVEAVAGSIVAITTAATPRSGGHN